MTLQLWNLTASFATGGTTSTLMASGQLVSSNTSTGIVPMQFPISGNSQPGQTRVTRVRLSKSSTITTNAAFRVHLYGVSPNSTSVFGGTWITDSAANYFGSFDVPSMRQFTDGCADIGSATTGNQGSDVVLRLTSGKTIYGLIEARSSYTSTSLANETFTATLETQDDY